MMGVREDKKKQLQEKIIASARELFKVKDFERVTMSQIAENAEVGLGTAYNYYASKEELFLLAGGTSFIFGEVLQFSQPMDSPKTLIDEIIAGFNQLAEIEKTSWRQSLSSLTKAAEKKPAFFLELVAIDHQFVAKVSNALKELQEQNILSAEMNHEILAELMYSTIFTSFLFYIYAEEQTVTELNSIIKYKLMHLLTVTS
ncbi:TetR/AcrR family transcriptional regulator [Vagococcus silagei]|uniref:TetR/AcrR family transcriptional regulator n=2 Tax=Vagococcus silagei TaxID=2508885 RepID=A0A4S3B606_9ENTE|nr:TetR/AcrR family transcriptional regulator [Vagococcus silagei]